MAKDLDLFGHELKTQGIQQVEDNNRDYVAEARAWAMDWAGKHGVVTSDDLWQHFPPFPWTNLNAVGAVFHSKYFEREAFTQTKRASGHARWITVWRLRKR